MKIYTYTLLDPCENVLILESAKNKQNVYPYQSSKSVYFVSILLNIIQIKEERITLECVKKEQTISPKLYPPSTRQTI